MSEYNSSFYVSLIYRALKSNDIKAVVIYIDSPGGVASTMESMFYAVRKLSEEKVTVAYVGGMAASGAYYVASACRYIVASPSSVVGNVGIIAVVPPLVVPSEYVIETGPYKATGFSYLYFPFNVSHILEKMANNIIEARRNRIRLTFHEIIQGKLYFAVEAIRLGLVDYEGSLIDAIELAAREAGLREYDIIYLNKGESSLPILPETLSWNITYSSLLSRYSKPTILLLYVPRASFTFIREDMLRYYSRECHSSVASYEVVLDLSHKNLITLLQFQTLQEKFMRYGAYIKIVASSEELTYALDKAKVLIIPTPSLDYSDEEIKVVMDYLDKGGRILLLFDPSLSYAYYMNSLSSRLGIVFSEGYLYNMKNCFGYYRNIYVYPSTADDLSENVSAIVLFTATHIYSNFTSYFEASNGTMSLVTENEDLFKPIVYSEKIVAIGDQTFLNTLNTCVADNRLFIDNIVRYLLKEKD
ncbi:MAG: hypothetical protein DRJ32_06135 [Thermoprotei archaeon]|nr:MAG: hypothetical protein DRJ32_06135 [Thermoprotei archaeon]